MGTFFSDKTAKFEGIYLEKFVIFNNSSFLMNNRRLFFFFLLFQFGAYPLLKSQGNQTSWDVVTLKNGSILKGNVLEMIPDSIIKLKLEGGSIFVLGFDEVEKITKEEGLANESLTGKSKTALKRDLNPFFYPDNTYRGTFETAFLPGNNGNGVQISLSVQSTHNWVFSSLLSAGLGVAAERYNSEFSVLSVFANVRGDLFNDYQVRPYYFLKAGYGFYLPGKTKQFLIDYSGGPSFGGHVGLHFHSRNRSSYYLGMGWQYQSIYRYFELWDWNGPKDEFWAETKFFRRIVLASGISF